MPWFNALAIFVGAIVLSFLMERIVGASQLSLLFLTAAVVASANWGRGPGILAAVLGVLAYDYFFLPPRFSFRVSEPELVSLFLLLGIALFIGHLADGLRQQAESARRGQERAQATARISRDFSGAISMEQVSAIAVDGIRRTLALEPRISFDSLATAPQGYSAIPMRAPRKTRGVLLVPARNFGSEEMDFLETVASLSGLAIERIHFVEVAGDALLRMQGERMRSRILSTLSHDLRTPLTGILAGVESLDADLGGMEDRVRSKTREVAAEVRRMSDLVGNLLELSRLQAGGVKLRQDWNSAEELIDGALRQRESLLNGREITIQVSDRVPLVWCDGVLVERVLVNLLDNAARHTPPETPLRMWVESGEKIVRIGLDDRGVGFDESKNGSEGIGLSLCRAIAESHGGTLETGCSPHGGARAVLVLPQDRKPPEPPEEEASE
jgi:two-component system sensor histidine kinase KdpD